MCIRESQSSLYITISVLSFFLIIFILIFADFSYNELHDFIEHLFKFRLMIYVWYLLKYVTIGMLGHVSRLALSIYVDRVYIFILFDRIFYMFFISFWLLFLIDPI